MAFAIRHLHSQCHFRVGTNKAGWLLPNFSNRADSKEHVASYMRSVILKTNQDEDIGIFFCSHYKKIRYI